MRQRRQGGVGATLTLKLHGKDPAAYLHAAILAADHGGVLLPWQFQAAA